MITIKQNEDYSKILQLQYADTNTAVDLTGITAYSQMRDKPNGTIVATAACVVDTTNHTITVSYSGSSLLNVEPGEYGFDIWVVDSGGKKHPIYTTRCKIVGRYAANF
ncbi:MAG: hypothetical protein IJI14_06240 [Anaerolineaceae bacterium]|nr:hypothetical protein [Anaerolineaceae bacterium]